MGNFSPRRWNIHDMDANSPRTNNNVEGWHIKLKWVARKAHPNVYELIEIFKQEQAHTKFSTVWLATGSQPPKKAKKFIAKDKRIEQLKKKFSQDTISLGEYTAI